MKVAYDLDGTVNADPEFYRSEMRGLMDRGHEVHILSGNPQAAHHLAQLGMVKGRDFTTCKTVPTKHIAAAKVAYMESAGVTHLCDNRGKNCKAARKAGFTAHHHMSPKKKD